MIDLKYLETFYEIAICGNMEAAASKLCITQPAISARLKKLQESIGAQLFTKEGRNLKLTTVGMQMLPYAKSYLRLQRDIHNLLSDKSNIVIGLSDFILFDPSYSYLLDWFRLEYAPSRIIIEIGSTEPLINQFQRKQIDLLALTQFKSEELGSTLTCRLELKTNTNMHIEDIESLTARLSSMAFICYPEIENFADKLARNSGIEPKEIVKCPNAHTAKNLLASWDIDAVTFLPMVTTATQPINTPTNARVSLPYAIELYK